MTAPDVARLVYAQQFRQYTDIRRHLPLLRARARGDVLELGVRGGASTSAFLAAAEDGRVDRVWSVDINNCGEIWAHRHPSWTFLQSDSLDPRLPARLPGAFDLLFVDTSHTYDQTLAELEAWEPLVKPSGLTLLHDGYEAGVRDAVRDYSAAAGRRCALRVGSFGMWVLWGPGPHQLAENGRTDPIPSYSSR